MLKKRLRNRETDHKIERPRQKCRKDTERAAEAAGNLVKESNTALFMSCCQEGMLGLSSYAGVSLMKTSHVCVCEAGEANQKKLSLWGFSVEPLIPSGLPLEAQVNVRILYFRPGMSTQTWQQQPVDIWRSLYFSPWITMLNDMVSYTRETIQPR